MSDRAVLLRMRNLALFGAAVFAAILLKTAWDDYDLARRRPPQRRLDSDDPAAARLEAHVRRLAGEIGRRSDRRPDGLEAAANYIRGEFARAGYAASEQPYTVVPPGAAEYAMKNLIAVLPAASPDAPVLVLGAHYDTALDTPGADDNASGVAALLELARSLRGLKSAVEIRFVAYATEEPPYFGTEEMGSAVHARALKKEGRRVLGMIGLEMLGYYDDAKGAQKYPPLLSPFFPDTADYVGAVSNLSSRAFLKSLARGYAPPRGTRLITASLPEWIGEITLSDHRNYWREGFPAVMVTDTAFLRNVRYHQTSDTPDTLDYARMADATAGLEAAVRALAEKR
jgi:hypothetical protein